MGGVGAEVDGGLEELDSFCSSVSNSSVMTAVACWIRIMDCSCCTSIACSLVFMLVTSKMWLLDSHLLTTFSPARSNVRSLAMRHACVVGCTPRARGDLPVVRDMKSSQDELPLEQLHVMHAGTRFHTSDKYPEGNPDLAITGRKWSMVVALPPQYTHLRPEATPLTHTIDFFGSAGGLVFVLVLVLLSSKAKEELALCTHLQDKLHTRFMAWAARDIVTNAALYLLSLNRDCSPYLWPHSLFKTHFAVSIAHVTGGGGGERKSPRGNKDTNTQNITWVWSARLLGPNVNHNQGGLRGEMQHTSPDISGNSLLGQRHLLLGIRVPG